MTYTEEERVERNLISTRKANKKWRENNKELYKELQNLYAKKYKIEFPVLDFLFDINLFKLAINLVILGCAKEIYFASFVIALEIKKLFICSS